MNSYELVRPDGTGSGVWSCGGCHRPHLVATLAGKPASDNNRRCAEECCAPRNCLYCGQITDRDGSGQFRREHEECIPKYEPMPPHHSMANPYARNGEPVCTQWRTRMHAMANPYARNGEPVCTQWRTRMHAMANPYARNGEPVCTQWRTRMHAMANPYARLLYQKMSDISEDLWCAGWLSGNEYALWEILHGDRREYGWGDVRSGDLEELRILSEHARGWIWTGPDKQCIPHLVTFAEWESIRRSALGPAWDQAGATLTRRA